MGVMFSPIQPVFANGFPKSGNHALVKACELLGVPADVNHRPYSMGRLINRTHLYIKRDPRNIVMSKIREQARKPTPGLFMAGVRGFDSNLTLSGSLRSQLLLFHPWLANPHTYVLRYEDLIANDITMRRLADFLKVPYFEGAWEELPGHTVSWRDGGHSDYRTIWSDMLEQEWQCEGGPALLEAWGYA